MVLFFRDQDITDLDQLRFAESFGSIDLPAYRTEAMERPEVLVIDMDAPKGQGTDSWHADASEGRPGR